MSKKINILFTFKNISLGFISLHFIENMFGGYQPKYISKYRQSCTWKIKIELLTFLGYS